MDKLAEVQSITRRIVAGYATRSLNATLYYIHDDANRIDSVVVVPTKRATAPHIMVMTRIDGEQVIIEVDTTDRPLQDALLNTGIPRSQIVLAYAGEHVPTP
jgi:hypothetical protein